MEIVIPYMAIVKLRLPAINRVQFVFWRIKMSAGAIICRFALSYNITGGGAPIFRQKSVAKNMADFHVCLRHLVPFGNVIYH